MGNNIKPMDVLVIGNGFDIAHGLKTRYSDFLSFINDEEYRKYNDEYSAEFEELVKTNCFIYYFATFKEVLPTWVDFEKEIEKIADAMETFFNKMPDVNRINQIKGSDVPIYTGKVLCDFDMAKNAFGLEGVYTLEPHYYDDTFGVKWNNVKEKLRNELKGLKRALSIYLEVFMPRTVSEELVPIEMIKNIGAEGIITFNYTKTYNLYFDDSIPIFHVHGELDKENIVLGFDDKNEDDLEFVFLKKYFQRIQNHTDDLLLKPFFVRDETGQSIQPTMHIFGLSLDVTDDELIRQIFNISGEMIVYYLDDDDYERKVTNLIAIFGKERFVRAYHKRGGTPISFVAI